MDLILNIGLDSKTKGNIGGGTAIREVVSYFGPASSFSFKHSDTELTCIASVRVNSELHYTDVENRIYFLARLLGQDCIAVYAPEQRKGTLIGPNAKAWGEFNPEFFILPDGTRLSEQIAQKTA